MAYNIVKFFHILAVVFMAAPLYNLIVVHERRRIGKAPFVVDRFFENIIKGAAIRCYVYQFTALLTGILLIPLAGFAWNDLIENPILLAKLLLLLSLTALLSVVHFRIQPAIESLLAEVQGDEIPEGDRQANRSHPTQANAVSDGLPVHRRDDCFVGASSYFPVWTTCHRDSDSACCGLFLESIPDFRPFWLVIEATSSERR